MADFFKSSDEDIQKQGENEEGEQEKVTIGDTDYEPEELQEMVGLASRVKDFEKKSGTPFDDLTSSWGRRGEEIGRLKKELEEEKENKLKEKSQIHESGNQQLSQEEQKRQLLEEARETGFVLKDDLDSYVDQKLNERDYVKNLLSTCSKKEKKIDGSDGRPAFKSDEIISYMSETGIKNPQDAYDLKYKPELRIWNEEQIKKQRPGGLITEESSSAGGKQPPEIKITRDNLEDAIKESLSGS